jgi:hypothetical protein
LNAIKLIITNKIYPDEVYLRKEIKDALRKSHDSRFNESNWGSLWREELKKYV